MGTTVHGHVAPGFERVRDTFEASFAADEIGAAVHMRRGDEVLVHLWGGVADRATGAPWKEDSLGLLFSATKGLAAACFLHLEDQGGADLDMPVAELWPELGEVVGDLSIRVMLSHRSGLLGISDVVTIEDLDDRDRMVSLLQSQTPHWKPGTDQGYHAVSYGLYAQEIFRRLTNRTLGTYLRTELTEPLGADVHLGLAKAHHGRVVHTIQANRALMLGGYVARALVGQRPEGMVARAMLSSTSDTRTAFNAADELGLKGALNWERPDVWERELPWAGAFGTAEAVAKVYAGLLNGSVSQRAIARVSPRISWSDHDRVLHKPMGFSQGFVKEGGDVFSPNPEAFGHPGMGGTLGWADPVVGVSIGYVMNHMSWRVRSPRALALCRAMYACLRAPVIAG